MTSTMRYEQLGVKGLKTMPTHDGGAYFYKLTVDGVVCAEVSQEGHGGPTDIRWVKGSEGLRESLTTLAVAREPLEGEKDPLSTTCAVECLLASLVDDFENNKRIKRMCRKQTIFAIPSDPAGTFRSCTLPFSADVKAKVLKKYPDATFYNETLK